LYNIIFYTAERGDSPLDDFLDGLDKKSRTQVAAYRSLREEQGPSGTAYIAYSSDRNVLGFQLNGSTDGMMLDGLPGL